MKRNSGGKGPGRPSRGLPYEVGKGKPPRGSQFKPGQSGNPRGRPKGRRSFADTVRKVLGRKIPVIERGQRKLVDAVEVMLHRYLKKALDGDVKAGAFLFGFLEHVQAQGAEEPETEALSEAEMEIVARLLKKTG